MPAGDWDEEIDEILDGDLTAALACVTPAGGAVATPVAPIGLRERERGTVTFTTSQGFGRKLERIRHNPKVALTYHAREHGYASSLRYVLVQGIAIEIAPPGLDPGARRAGLLAHEYRPQLVGLRVRQHTGWIEIDEDRCAALYAPHTEGGFAAPPNKTLLLLANGFMARRGLRQAMRAQATQASG